ncbi:TIGR03013 family XrtA/PEP-CTERM system glycosyltransferase [Aliagarivorans taiwanensis]|uniref:TIGR03013 family XrtA/PEP-CTERM system glycosyltransferase n=1 Tax=Aliagarivorans taiwanensis TaxID=561966 RepID=UPI000403B93C|nr:TIGR03013 family XrtA/PEP-CTERM system glycosyltransferase [Aliagarivorans taiwanensis]
MAGTKFHNLDPGSRAIVVTEFLVLTGIMLIAVEVLRLSGTATPEYFNSNFIIELFCFVLPIQLSILAVGLYNQKIRETFRGVIRRLVVSVALGYFVSSVIYVISPLTVLDGNFREFLYAGAMIGLTFTRFFALKMQYEHLGRKRVLVLGAGERASIIERRMRRKADRVSFELVGFVKMPGDSAEGIKSETLIELDQPIEAYVLTNGIEEIVIAADERRTNLPVDSLFLCKLRGIEITDIIDFIERESGQIAVNLIYPSWVIYSNGFQSTNYLRSSLDWIFNTVLAMVVSLLTWPMMLLTIIFIKLEEGFKAPVLYSQERIGLNGRPFNIYKFRSMRTDAERDGAKWAQKEDPRVTKVGNFIRKYRIDELPQLYNVFRGDMGFVGPRPERPAFVKELVLNIPYYNQRHNVKPGLTGWAQLKYPYGSSEADSLEKLKFDLYYIKHRSFLLDLLILVRTAEIVLFGKGR